MKTAKLQIWAWVLIYGGLLLLCLGLFASRADAAMGWMMVLVGGALVATGMLLIVLRSRMGP